jgi:Secretion system C-terminal sorting domain
MKKNTLTLLAILFASTFFGQTYSTGTINLTTGYSAKIDVTSSIVTLTLIGPSSGWLGLSFDSVQMDDLGKDVVIFDGTNLTDRTFNGQGVIPPLDATQNWTVSSNNIVTGVRTVVATRARDTGDLNDYIFSASAQPINLVWARKLANLSIGYHGGNSCGATVANFTLATIDFESESFKMYPNPSKNFTTIELPTAINKGEVKIYDSLGKLVIQQSIASSSNKIDTSSLTQGSYLVVVRTDFGNSTKKLMME